MEPSEAECPESEEEGMLTEGGGTFPFGKDPRDDSVRAAEIAEELRLASKPQSARTYNTSEPDFWRHRHVPIGSVLVYTTESTDLVAAGSIAVLVTGYESLENGVWLDTKILGCSSSDFAKQLHSKFKGTKKKRHHVCYPDAEGQCAVPFEAGIHLTTFDWHPPGEFKAPWLSKKAEKEVMLGLVLEKEAKDAAARRAGAKVPVGTSPLEKKLEALKSRASPRVSFATPGAEASSEHRPAPVEGFSRAGALRRPGATSSAPARLALQDKVKKEAEVVEIEDSPHEKARKRTKSKAIGEALALAVAVRQKKNRKEGSKKKPRSRSRSKEKGKKKKRKRRDSSSQGSSEDSSGAESSSSSSLQPPLKRKAMKEPGSVFRLLLNQATEQLAQEGLEIEGSSSLVTGKPKVKLYSFYQLALKPSLDPRSRDCKEIALLARGLDLLQEGDLTALADLLAARLIAVETATRQGWQTAKFLEIQSLEDDGTAPPHILLAAQRHSRQVEKAGGKNSWGRGQAYQWEWGGDGRGRGKGKDPRGKGKKGKGKGRGKGNWTAWNSSEKEKAAEKAGKGETS